MSPSFHFKFRPEANRWLAIAAVARPVRFYWLTGITASLRLSAALVGQGLAPDYKLSTSLPVEPVRKQEVRAPAPALDPVFLNQFLDRLF